MNGVKFAQPGKRVDAIDPQESAYTTEDDIVQVDFTADPPHLGIIDPLQKASAYTLTTTTAQPTQFREEVLFQVKHGLPFVPDFVCYFYAYDSPYPQMIGTYRLDYYRVGFGGEYIQAIADDTYFKIIHSVSVTGVPGFPATMPYTWTVDLGSQMKFRVKYMILQRPTQGELTYAPA